MEISKRAELHLHTKMSQMDALISPTEAVKAAKDMGQNLDFVAKVLNVSPQTIRRMESNFASAHLKTYQKYSQVEK